MYEDEPTGIRRPPDPRPAEAWIRDPAAVGPQSLQPRRGLQAIASDPAPSGLGPNPYLPPINPLKARSTIAGLLVAVGALSGIMGGGVGEVLTEIALNAEAIQAETDRAIAAFNVLVMFVGYVWTWAERRAPWRRLSFKAPLR